MDDQDRREQAREARAQAREARAQAREQGLEQAREQRARGRDRTRDQRERDRERRITEHVSQDRERRHMQPPHRARGLAREDIIDAAIAVADAEGTDAVSMRRIARELGVGAMSLYWHVESKDELQMLMLDAVQAELPESSGDWRADLTEFAHTARDALMRHPWAIGYLLSGPPVGPNDARHADRLMAALDGHGLDVKTVSWIAMAVSTYVAGAVVREAQEIRWHREAAAMIASMSADEAEKLHAQYVERLGDPDRFPHMARLVAEGFDPDAPQTRDERFEFGLDCLLDGIAVRFGLPRR